MVRNGSRFDLERVRKLGEKKYGSRFKDHQTWAREAGVSIPTLRSFLLDEESAVKMKTVDQIVAPFGLVASDIIRRNTKKAS